MTAMCANCGLPQFEGAAGYVGPQCKCFVYDTRRSYTAPPSDAKPCFCIGPQNGQPLCPCQMRNVVVKNGRYVKPEQDLGPVITKDAE